MTAARTIDALAVALGREVHKFAGRREAEIVRSCALRLIRRHENVHERVGCRCWRIVGHKRCLNEVNGQHSADLADAEAPLAVIVVLVLAAFAPAVRRVEGIVGAAIAEAPKPAIAFRVRRWCVMSCRHEWNEGKEIQTARGCRRPAGSTAQA